MLMMVFYKENITQFILFFLLVEGFVFILSKSFTLLFIISIALLVVYKYIRRRKVVFGQKCITICKGPLRSKDIVIEYADLNNVFIEQIYTTTYVNAIVKIDFSINDKTEISRIDISDYSKLNELIELLETRNVRISFSDDYIEMISKNKKS